MSIRHFTWLVVAAAPVAVRPVPLHAQAIPEITLEEALRRSRIVSPSVIGAQGSLRNAELSTSAAIWQFIPSLSFQPQANLALSSGQSRIDPVTQEVISGNQSNPSFGFGLNASYTLFDGFARNHALSAQRANERAAAAGLTNAQAASDYVTTSAYFAVLTRVHVVSVAEGNLEAAESQLRLASAKLHSGSGRVTDSLTALGGYQQATLALLQARSDAAVSQSALGRLVGISGRMNAIDDPAYHTTPVPLDTAAIRQQVLTTGPDIVTLTANLASAQQFYQGTKTGYLPTLDVTAFSNWTGNDASNYSLVARRGLNLQLSISPWTNMARERSIESASISVSNAEAALADARNSLYSQVDQIFASLVVAQTAIGVSQGAVESGTLNLRLVTEQYRSGVSNVSELVTATQQLAAAQASEVTARFSYLLAKALLESLVGHRVQ